MKEKSNLSLRFLDSKKKGKLKRESYEFPS